MNNQALAIKYRPHTWDDVVEADSIKIILQQQLAGGQIQHAYLFAGASGCGKAQPLYSQILTPTGFIKMGDIKVGDKVYTHSGKITEVTAIYPQGDRDIYEITLQDKTCIRVADNHLNSVYRYNSDKRQREEYVLTTLDLIDFVKESRFKLRIDTPKVDWPEQKVLINPYLLGVLIGDGSLCGNFCLSNTENDILQKVNKILQEDYGMKLVSNNGKDHRICYINNPGHNGSKGDRGLHALVRNYEPLETLKGQLDFYKLLCKSTEKHIPKEYLLNSKEVRMQLLQGLYDTDGYTAKGGATNFTTSSKQLSKDFEFLVRSLGIRDTVSCSPTSYTDDKGKKVVCSDSYTHYLHMPKDFRYCTSKKHLTRYKNRQYEPIRNIVDIKYIGKEPCQCIMVEDNDHTYISDFFIPTHNTTCARIFANEINKGQGNPIEMDAASNSGVDDVRNIIQQAKSKSLDSEYKVFIIDEAHSISNTGWQAFLKLIEEPPAKSIFIFATTDPQKIPKTILSRVQRYDFKRISQKGIVDRLQAIYATECGNVLDGGDVYIHTSVSDSAIEYIAKIAEGGMRSAISYLDKCLAYSTDLTLENVIRALGTVDYDIMFELTYYIVNKQEKEAIQVIEDIHMNGKDLKLFIKQYMQFLLDIQKWLLKCPNEYIQLPLTAEYERRLQDIPFEPSMQLLSTIINLNSDIKWDTMPKVAIECAILMECEGE